MQDSVKEEVFRMLEEKRGESLSGEKLAEALGVSRNAVWKAVRSLREEGCEIEAVPNRGYRLKDNTDRLSAAAIRALLEEADIEPRVYEELDSTNDEAKRLLAAGLEGNALLVANTQTGGRGRMGRSFYSPAGTGIYMTLVLRPKASMEDAVTLTTAAAVAVVEAIESLCAKRAEIKWVNDVYLEGKKICGILTEAVVNFETAALQSVLVGIGLNMHTNDFPKEIEERASSLDAQGVSRNEMIAAITNAMLRLLKALPAREYLAVYRAHSMVIGKEVKYLENGESFFALATGIDESGGLIVRHADGSEKTLRSGEITLRIV